MATTADSSSGASDDMKRDIDWKGGFWIASGVPALVLFSIGGIAATVGTPSWLVWTVSIVFGLIQAFTYAEIAGLFPNKSGGASIYGAAAWLPYGKFLAPISVWCNWVAWTPVLAIGSGLGAGYLLSSLVPEDSSIQTWNTTLVDLGGVKEGLELRINATFVVGAVLMLAVFAIQHHGVLRTARVQTILGLAVIIPLLIVGIVPFFNGRVDTANFSPFEPLNGAWDVNGWTLVLGGLFIAAWSTYGFETAVCYTREYRNPGRDTVRAIFAAGLLCLVIFFLVPFAFQGSFGIEFLSSDPIYAGYGVGDAMAQMVGGGGFIQDLIVIMLVLALLLTIMTAMAGSSRTLYQGSRDGWLPRYLGHVNTHGAPTRAMWTDLGFNLILLAMSDYLFILAVSNCCYLIFNFLNLNAGWIHRKDNAHIPRPWRAPTIMLALGTILAFVNMFLLGAGANVYGPNTLLTGVIAAALIIPVFLYRHYVQDKGQFPPEMLKDLQVEGGAMTIKKCGALPYLALAGGVIVVVASYWYFWVSNPGPF